MNHYWSCSKFADWVRGTPKGGPKDSEGWDLWKEDAKQFNPIRFWLAEKALTFVENIVYFIPNTYYSIIYYINNRWVTKTQSLTAHKQDIKPGSWCDIGHRFLPCLFNELVDFVEMELAWSHVAWLDKADQKKYNVPFWRTSCFFWRIWRSPKAGLDSLEWQRNLVYDNECALYKKGEPTLQAISAQEILDLYTWWTQVYQTRPDPYDASGWTEVCENRRLVQGSILKEITDPKLKKQNEDALKNLHEIEKMYEKEDEEMIIRLIKVRNSLWT